LFATHSPLVTPAMFQIPSSSPAHHRPLFISHNPKLAHRHPYTALTMEAYRAQWDPVTLPKYNNCSTIATIRCGYCEEVIVEIVYSISGNLAKKTSTPSTILLSFRPNSRYQPRKARSPRARPKAPTTISSQQRCGKADVRPLHALDSIWGGEGEEGVSWSCTNLQG
jgi:hypothetical protein